MGPDGKGTAKAAVYIDGQPVQYAGEITLPEEALAIRWHMGAYDDAAKTDSRAMSAAMAASPWVWRLQEADMCAAWIDEREAGQ